LYGSEEKRAEELRESSGGRLKVHVSSRGRHYSMTKNIDGKRRVIKNFLFLNKIG